MPSKLDFPATRVFGLLGLFFALAGLCVNAGWAVGQQKAVEPPDAFAATMGMLERLPERAEVITFSVKSKESKAEPSVASELRERLIQMDALFTALAAGLSEASAEKLGEFEAIVIYGRRQRVEEVFGSESQILFATTVVLHTPDDDAARTRKVEIDKSLSADFDVIGDSGTLRVYESKDPKKKDRRIASGVIDGRQWAVITDVKEDLARLTAAKPSKEGALREDIRDHIERMKDHFKESSFLHLVREDARISAYFPSGPLALCEIRRFDDPITPSYFPSFKDRIGKLEVPPPSWVVTVMFPPYVEEAKIVDKYSYEIVRRVKKGSESGPVFFINLSRLGERPDGDPDFKMPKDWGRL